MVFPFLFFCSISSCSVFSVLRGCCRKLLLSRHVKVGMWFNSVNFRVNRPHRQGLRLRVENSDKLASGCEQRLRIASIMSTVI